MLIKKSKCGFTLIEVIVALALLGILSVSFSAILVTCLKLINISSAITKGTNAAVGQIENWESGNMQNIVTSNGDFAVTFSSKNTSILQSGKYVTGKDEKQNNAVKTFKPNNQIIQPTNEAIVCKDTLTINNKVTSSQITTIDAKTVLLYNSVNGSPGSLLYSDTSPKPTGFSVNYTRIDNYKTVLTPIPIAAVTTYTNYTGGIKTFDVTNGDQFFYVENFDVRPNGTITVTNNSATTTHKNLYVFIKNTFAIHASYKLTVQINGIGSNYTAVYFIYCGDEAVYLDGDIINGVLSPSDGISCSTTGCYIYAPSADVSLIATGLSGVIGANVTINGNDDDDTSFLPVSSSSGKPSWQDLILKLIGT
jgi:prepilin-type N-terminal cleavage/methylation domain-containing protein